MVLLLALRTALCEWLQRDGNPKEKAYDLKQNSQNPVRIAAGNLHRRCIPVVSRRAGTVLIRKFTFYL